MKLGIFYGTTTGSTEEVAEEISSVLGESLVTACENIEDLELDDLQGYDVLVLGVPTWDVGELPYDWAILYENLENYDFTNTKIVMFGLGDQAGYPETFLDAMGIVYRGFLDRGAVGGGGFWPTEPYTFTGSLATYEDKFCGLAIDHDNESGMTDERVEEWCDQIKRELSLGA